MTPVQTAAAFAMMGGALIALAGFVMRRIGSRPAGRSSALMILGAALFGGGLARAVGL